MFAALPSCRRVWLAYSCADSTKVFSCACACNAKCKMATGRWVGTQKARRGLRQRATVANEPASCSAPRRSGSRSCSLAATSSRQTPWPPPATWSEGCCQTGCRSWSSRCRTPPPPEKAQGRGGRARRGGVRLGSQTAALSYACSNRGTMYVRSAQTCAEWCPQSSPGSGSGEGRTDPCSRGCGSGAPSTCPCTPGWPSTDGATGRSQRWPRTWGSLHDYNGARR